ncbi:hypothetical protein EIP91_003105 [Steccherinum ochraceum]|uniref:Major facilitator superfamily (MFS) profile domain-containing protein n=1 Tax=Steccherinum ochraceum TaxID=92696 RepID=A0A4R0RWS6_9APHY|nr:hypothetical protein EIP91_003105 [Steccherinum ochraceum]
MLSRDEEATLADPTEGHFAIHHLNEVTEPIDPRIQPSEKATPKELDEPLSRQLSDYVHHRDPHKAEHGASPSGTEEKEDVLYIEFEKGDPRNPLNFTRRRKWAITIPAVLFTFLSAATASTYGLGFDSMTRDLNCTRFQATVGLSTYALGFAVVPLVTASFSEEFGRQPLYLVSVFCFTLMHLMVALSKNIQTVQIARFLAGSFGSTGSTMVGGTISDIWLPYERGLPMAVFSVTALGGTGLGPVAAGWIEMNSHLEWRWIQWIHMILTGLLALSIPIFMRETRAAVLLTRIARKTRKKTGDHRYRARVEDERASLKTLIYISCTRPIYLLFTEPVVASFSLWVGFAWGILYVLIESITPVFKGLHNFNVGETGTIFVTFFIGSLIGIASDRIQEKLYQKNFATRGPEARLYHAMFAGVLFPAAMFIYAWCTFPNVHWISLAIGIVLFIWALFAIYLTVFTYLADCYGPFASSALAGQSLCRNLAGMAFPLFTNQMYAAMTYKWANTLFALLAALMIPIPFILFKWGPKIRAKSKFASQVMQKQP